MADRSNPSRTVESTELDSLSPTATTRSNPAHLTEPLLENRATTSPRPQDDFTTVPTPDCPYVCNCGANLSPVQTNSKRRYSTPKGPIPQGIYWWSPFGMVSFFAVGILFSALHNIFYCWFNGRRVSGDWQQLWVIRGGSTFAYIVQASLVMSVGYSFVQTLWNTLKRRKVSVKGLDAAFEAGGTLWSLRNPEMLRKLKLVSFLCIISGCLPIPSIFTPATLLVIPSSYDIWSQIPVPVLDMTGSQWKRFAYSVNKTAVSPLLFLGPRTVIAGLCTATATLGRILDLAPPSVNSSYSLVIHGPAAECDDLEPTSTTAKAIDTIRNQSIASYTGDLREYINNYFVFVPDLSSSGTSDMSLNNVKMAPQNRLQTPANASNELWMVYSRYSWNTTGVRITTDHYSTCKLVDASYDLTFSFQDGTQHVTINTISLGSAVDYPDNDSPSTNVTQQQHAYSAVFWAISDLLVGSMGVFTQTSDNRTTLTNFTEITTQIEHTRLLGSSDLDPFFDNSHFLYSNSTAVGDQRQEDIALAKNRTLNVLTEELFTNATISFMTSSKLSPLTYKNVTQSLPINIYAYHSFNLITSYSVAIFFTLIANLLGAYSYYRNGHAHSKSFSAILAATRDEDLSVLFFADMLGRLPLHENVEKAQLRFGLLEGGGLGFREEKGSQGDEADSLNNESDREIDGADRARHGVAHVQETEGDDGDLVSYRNVSGGL